MVSGGQQQSLFISQFLNYFSEELTHSDGSKIKKYRKVAALASPAPPNSAELRCPAVPHRTFSPPGSFRPRLSPKSSSDLAPCSSHLLCLLLSESSHLQLGKLCLDKASKSLCPGPHQRVWTMQTALMPHKSVSYTLGPPEGASAKWKDNIFLFMQQSLFRLNNNNNNQQNQSLPWLAVCKCFVPCALIMH